MSPAGFLLVYSDPGQGVTEEEFTDWYDNEHVPLRVEIPAFLSWHRWAADDNKKPRWAASYDLTSFEATLVPPYSTLAETRSEREKDVLKRVETLDRRTYEVWEGALPPPSELYDPAKGAPYTVFVSVDVKPGAEEEYNKWYDEEHIPLLSKCPGWIRSRRFVLKDWSLGGTQTQGVEPTAPPKFLAVHEWVSPARKDSEEYKAAMNTPWKDRVAEDIIRRDLRIFKHHKTWERN